MFCSEINKAEYLQDLIVDRCEREHTCMLIKRDKKLQF